MKVMKAMNIMNIVMLSKSLSAVYEQYNNGLNHNFGWPVLCVDLRKSTGSSFDYGVWTW